MGFPKQEYLSELPFPPPRNLPEPGIEPMFPVFAGGFFTTALPVQSLFLTFCLFLFSNFPSYSIIPAFHEPKLPQKSVRYQEIALIVSQDKEVQLRLIGLGLISF